MAKYFKMDEMEALLFKLKELKELEEKCIFISSEVANIIESDDKISSEHFEKVKSVLNENIAYIQQLIFTVSANMNEEVYGPPRSSEVTRLNG